MLDQRLAQEPPAIILEVIALCIISLEHFNESDCLWGDEGYSIRGRYIGIEAGKRYRITS
jgi:hypothetical protein